MKKFVARVTQLVPHVEQEPLTLPKHLSSSLVFSGVHVARSLDWVIASIKQ